MGRIELERLFEQVLRSHDVLEPAFVESGDAAEIIVERVGIRLVFRSLRLGRNQFAAQLIGEARDDLVLHVEQVGDRLVEPVGPDVVARRGVDELGVDPHPARAALNAAFEDVTDIEFPADLLGVDRLALVGESRIARDDDRVGKPGEIGCETLGHAVHELFLLFSAAETGERQHDDRAPRRPGLLRRRFEGRRPWLRGHADLERIDAQRLGDVFKLLEAEIADGEFDSPSHLPVGVLGERDRAGLGDAFEPRGDVHAIAHQVAVGLLDDVAEVDADPKLDAAIVRKAGVSLDETVLHLNPAAHRIDDAPELDEDAVAGAFHHPAIVNRNAGVDQIAAERPEPGQDAVLVRAGKPRKADNVGDQYRRELARHNHQPSSAFATII